MPGLINSDDHVWVEYSSSDQHLIPRDLLTEVYTRCKAIDSKNKQQAQRRGYALQNLIYSILYHEGLTPRTSYRPKGEEIDGSFYFNHGTFLLEAKWTAGQTPASVTYAFRGKCEGKLIGTKGVFISMSGYSDDAPETLEKGKPISIILFDQSDMDAILIHKHKFVEVLDFKLRHAGEVGDSYVPFELPAKIAKVQSRSMSDSLKQKGLAYLTPAPARWDLGYGSRLILVICESVTDTLVLENLLQRLIKKWPYWRVSIELKSLGSRLRTLRTLPSIVNIMQHYYGHDLSGIIVVLDIDPKDSPAASALGKQIEEYIDELAIPVSMHLSYASPSVESWIGLEKLTLSGGRDKAQFIQDAVKKSSPDELLANNEIKDMINFIRRVSTADEPIWETDAREAVERALANAEWKPQEGSVFLLPLGDKEPTTVCRSIDDLRAKLTDIAATGADNSMPYESGEPVFEIDYWYLIDDVLMAEYEKQVEEMGWEL